MPALRCLELAVGGIRVAWPGDFDGGGGGADQRWRRCFAFRWLEITRDRTLGPGIPGRTRP